MNLLTLSGLSVTRRKRPVLRNVSLQVAAGEFVGLIGRNGAGKSTLMEAALGLIPFGGRSSLAELTPARRARHAAYLPQAREIAWPVSVEVLIALGRIPWPGASNAQDRTAVDAAIARMALEPFRQRTASRLSGGEQARALIARVLAQETPLMIADEPIAGLDPSQQLSCLSLFSDLAAEGRGILVSVHDLGLAARFCSRLVLLSGGKVLADGPPHAVLSDDNLARGFGVRAQRIETADGPVILPTAAL